jgi:hypothetical protein
MSYEQQDDDGPRPARSRRPLLLLAAALLLVAAFLGGRVLAPLVRGGSTPRRGPTAAESPKPAERPTPAISPAPTPEPEEKPADPKPRARRKAEPPPAPAAPAAPTTAELQIESDVPGAMVFLDRVYLGTAPVTASKVSPGQHQLNVSAEGYEGYAETVDVEPGRREITVRFKEVRLNEAIQVVHKHGMGSCEGRLVADPQGVRYETSSRDDAFSLGFADVETFEVDYLKKNLRVKRRGGKTWNFTTKAENADPLFVFHRNVDKVRQKLAASTPARGK